MFGHKGEQPTEGVAVRARDVTPAAQQPGLLDSEVARLSALSLPDLAVEVMTKSVSVQASDPEGTAMELYNLVRVMMPAELRDQAETDRRLLDLVGEGIQVLEQARLVRLDVWAQSQTYHTGYTATRRGRSALEANTVGQILKSGSS